MSDPRDQIPMITKLGAMLRSHQNDTVGVRATLFTLSEEAGMRLSDELQRIGIPLIQDHPMVRPEPGYDFKFAGVNGHVVREQRVDILVQSA